MTCDFCSKKVQYVYKGEISGKWQKACATCSPLHVKIVDVEYKQRKRREKEGW